MAFEKPKTANKPQQDENDSNVIKEPKEVQESNDEKIDQDFPGYPHYPAKDDILDPEKPFEKK